MITVCFTGHRPNKLGGYDWNNNQNAIIRNRIRSAILKLIDSNPDEKEFRFISGMAIGVDQFAMHEVLEIKNGMPDSINIITECAIPFKNQASKWFSKDDTNRYEYQLSVADRLIYVDTLDKYKIKGYNEDTYHPAKLQKRNEYMVDSSEVIIAVWDGTAGGTKNCVDYAKKNGKEIIFISPNINK